MLATAPRSANHWPDSACARAFWGQQDLPPYRRLLSDTAAWLDPEPGECWLDLGCGCGQLTEALWQKSRGTLREIVGLDCAAVNEKAFRKLRSAVTPPASEGSIRFAVADFSNGLPEWDDERFDGIVSGLAIQYAECYSEEQGRWTTDAYGRLLSETFRVLRKGGRFVFSVNVPEPAWGKVALHALPGIFRARQPGRYLKNSWRMLRYGAWLTREARHGRFHYLPIQDIQKMLAAAGYQHIEYRLTYARQAYLIRCVKPVS
jgi:ubiquinone/menaquinone biosynthesis C-methylase UbiE